MSLAAFVAPCDLYVCSFQYLNCRGSHLGRLQEGFKSSRFTATHNFAQGKTGVTFEELFQMVDVEDFSSYLSKINTPRELLIMMTYIISRLESNPAGNLTAQDMEIAVDKAKEQNV